jgi:hypothetical protein
MHARFRRRLITLAPIIVAAIAALAPGQAAADQPVREGLPAAPFTLDASICGFAVDVTFPTNKEFSTTFADGKQIITGSLTATLTNEENGRSITINISGPGSFVPNGDGTTTFTLSGRSLIYLFPNQVGQGTPGRLILTSGPVAFQVDQNGNLTSYRITSASVQDMCPVLAGQ